VVLGLIKHDAQVSLVGPKRLEDSHDLLPTTFPEFASLVLQVIGELFEDQFLANFIGDCGFGVHAKPPSINHGNWSGDVVAGIKVPPASSKSVPASV
jgi:hypothetical protein